MRSWTARHIRVLTFVRARFSVQHFSGMPLTLFVAALLMSTFTLFGIVEDYLTNDPLALASEPFSTAPIIPSFYNSSPHDFGLQKITGAATVRSRHHARLWKLNYETELGSILVGTVSRDTGMKWGIAHSIDPAIDVERDFLVSDLERTGMIAQIERVPFAPSKLGKNFAGDPFFTDGKIVVITLKHCP